MEFHRWCCCLLLWLVSLLACAQDPMDEINTLVYQYPAEAKQKIAELEEAHRHSSPSPVEELRLKLLKCELLLQFGENEAAINLAQMGEATAKRIGADHVRPYFMSCLADAYSAYDNLQIALPLLDTAISLAKRYQQPQAMVMALRLRGQLDTETDNLASAIEDLRLALDAYDNISAQDVDWAWPPKAFVFAAMGNLLFVTHDYQQAMYYTELGLKSPECIGKIRQVLLLNASRIAMRKGDTVTSDAYLQEARQLLPELSTPLELAVGYATIAAIEIERGNSDKAKDLLDVALNTFEQQQKQLYSMRTKRLLALIAFDKGDEKTELKLMDDAIGTAERMQVYSELESYYLTLSEHSATKANFKQAYQLLNKSYQAAKNAHKATSDTRMQQFQARLSQRASDATLEKLLSENLEERSSISWMYMVLLAMILLLLTLVLWQLLRHVYLRKQINEPPMPQSPLEHLELAMEQAKHGHHSLSILLLNIRDISPVDLPSLKAAIEKRLRETDMILRFSADELLLLLPYTSNSGAELVMKQLQPVLDECKGRKIALGHASMHQFDTTETLLKRASVRGMSRAQLGN
ncbi:hypothetical protein [Shewanella sp.]|uniref:hypothetical protein n=1 Tax=Shewanella sp. TaxID=50422 RepID=UPI00356726EF